MHTHAQKKPRSGQCGVPRRELKRPYNHPLSTGGCNCPASEEEKRTVAYGSCRPLAGRAEALAALRRCSAMSAANAGPGSVAVTATAAAPPVKTAAFFARGP